MRPVQWGRIALHTCSWADVLRLSTEAVSSACRGEAGRGGGDCRGEEGSGTNVHGTRAERRLEKYFRILDLYESLSYQGDNE